MAIDEQHVWVSVPVPRLVLGIDPHRRAEDVRFHLSATPVALAAGDGRLWIAARTVEGSPGRLLRVDADSGEQSGPPRSARSRPTSPTAPGRPG